MHGLVETANKEIGEGTSFILIAVNAQLIVIYINSLKLTEETIGEERTGKQRNRGKQ